MTRHTVCLPAKISLFTLPFCLLAVVCFGQNKEKDSGGRHSKYMNQVYSECKAAEGYNYDCFVAQLTKIVEANPGNAVAYNLRGIVYSPRDPDRAIADFNKVSELDPLSLLAYSHLASAYRGRANMAEQSRF